MACINHRVSFPPKLAAFIQISQEEKPPAHVITPPMPVSHGGVADGVGQDCDRNYAATLHCPGMLPAALEFPKAGSPAPCPAQAAPLPGHNPLQQTDVGHP